MDAALLTSPIVFACRCDIQPGEIHVGMLVQHEDFEPGQHILYASNGDAYPVQVPLLSTPDYNVILKRTDYGSCI